MKQYKDNIRRVLSLLVFMVKTSDRERVDRGRIDKKRLDKVDIDILFTQAMTKVNAQKSSKISSSVDQVSFFGVPDMRGKLQPILQGHINQFGTSSHQPPRPVFSIRPPPPQAERPLSLYILTDAKWQPTDVGGLIKDVVQSMIAKNCPKEHVAIQFIRFSDDQASIEKLNELDHGLGLKAMGM